MYKKFKSIVFDEVLFFALLLVMVALISFGLGRSSILSVGNLVQKPAGIIFHDSSKSNLMVVQNRPVVGSRSGSKYYLLDCLGASRIKGENKIYFYSYKLAEAAGYSQAANCDGF